MESLGGRLDRHCSSPIGQPEPASCCQDQGQAIGVETEKPDAGFVTGLYIGPQVQFGKRSDRRKPPCEARTEIRHLEWHNGDPRRSLVFIDMEPPRNMTSEGLARNAVMDEGQVEPRLPPVPTGGRQRPRTMLGFSQGWMHGAEGSRPDGAAASSACRFRDLPPTIIDADKRARLWDKTPVGGALLGAARR